MVSGSDQEKLSGWGQGVRRESFPGVGNESVHGFGYGRKKSVK